MIAADCARLGRALQAPYDRAANELSVAIGIVKELQERRFPWQVKINRTPVK